MSRESRRTVALLIAVSALSLAAAGCGWRTTPIYSLGQYQMEKGALFGRLQQTLMARGYQLQTADESRGLLVAQASYVHRGTTSTFTIQCYQDGWVSVTLSGGYVRLKGNRAKVPAALKDEYETLVLALEQSLGPRAGQGQNQNASGGS